MGEHFPCLRPHVAPAFTAARLAPCLPSRRGNPHRDTIKRLPAPIWAQAVRDHLFGRATSGRLALPSETHHATPKRVIPKVLLVEPPMAEMIAGRLASDQAVLDQNTKHTTSTPRRVRCRHARRQPCDQEQERVASGGGQGPRGRLSRPSERFVLNGPRPCGSVRYRSSSTISATKDRSQSPAKGDATSEMNTCKSYVQGKDSKGVMCECCHPMPCHNGQRVRSCRLRGKRRYPPPLAVTNSGSDKKARGRSASVKEKRNQAGRL